ncbi:putative penicillin-binding protein [Rosellinia necatrix]|uniref:Putative penicillin-binding protein n=1 Tax=Rosellinia necatrix TaxID=77044 RepID=A0A1W2TTT2_ROSNE|nr:putative penicillin-binding protein [Rosellinia necatrix]
MTFEPGSFRTTWSYNALVYSLAGLIIERASGISYSDFMLSNVFAPLGMTRTRVVPLRSINERQSSFNTFAIPYVISEDGARHQIAIKNYGYGPFASSAGCESTVTDILRFSKALMATKSTAAVNMELLSNEAASLPNEVGHILNVSCILPPSRFGTLSYCLGLFHMDGHHITEHLVDEILVSGTTQPYAQQNASLMSKKVPAPPGPNRKIYFHSGYVPGFYSVLYLFPQTNSAVTVLENSSGGGDCAGRVGYLLSAVVSGDEPPRDLLGSAEAEREMDRCRWHTINQLLQNNLLCLQENDLGPRLAFENISGRYLNSTFGITIIICDYYDTDTQRTEPSGWELFFRSRDSQGLRLTPYHGTTWCFLPSKAAYYRRNMRHLSSWSQFLVHLHFDAGANEPRGLWWQYELTVDAIWFERAGDC